MKIWNTLKKHKFTILTTFWSLVYITIYALLLIKTSGTERLLVHFINVITMLLYINMNIDTIQIHKKLDQILEVEELKKRIEILSQELKDKE